MKYKSDNLKIIVKNTKNKLIATKQEELKNIPTIDEIIASIKDKNQLEQLKKLLEKQKATNNMLAKQKGRI